jgi:hypothetical protein
MFSAMVVALNNLPETQRSFHTCVDSLLAGEPYMDLTNVTARLQGAHLDHSPAEAGLNGGPDAAVTPRASIAGPI